MQFDTPGVLWKSRSLLMKAPSLLGVACACIEHTSPSLYKVGIDVRPEVANFCRFVAPSKDETAARVDAVERVAAVVKAIWPSATVEVFGSFVTGKVALQRCSQNDCVAGPRELVRSWSFCPGSRLCMFLLLKPGCISVRSVSSCSIQP